MIVAVKLVKRSQFRRSSKSIRDFFVGPGSGKKDRISSLKSVLQKSYMFRTGQTMFFCFETLFETIVSKQKQWPRIVKTIVLKQCFEIFV